MAGRIIDIVIGCAAMAVFGIAIAAASPFLLTDLLLNRNANLQ